MGGWRWLKTVSIAKASAASLLGSILHSSKKMAVSQCAAKPEQAPCLLEIIQTTKVCM
jgi:hypothetical protein